MEQASLADDYVANVVCTHLSYYYQDQLIAAEVSVKQAGLPQLLSYAEMHQFLVDWEHSRTMEVRSPPIDFNPAARPENMHWGGRCDDNRRLDDCQHYDWKND